MLVTGAVGTGLVVIVIAVAIVLVVFLVTASMRSRQQSGDKRRAEAHQDLGEAQERARQAEHELDAKEAADERAPRSDQGG